MSWTDERVENSRNSDGRPQRWPDAGKQLVAQPNAVIARLATLNLAAAVPRAGQASVMRTKRATAAPRAPIGRRTRSAGNPHHDRSSAGAQAEQDVERCGEDMDHVRWKMCVPLFQRS